MLINSFENNQKIALKTEKQSFLFDDIFKIIVKKASFFQKIKSDILLISENEIENLLNLLAVMYVGKKAIYASKNLSESQLDSFSEKYFAVENLEYENLEPLILPQSQLDSDLFLGVLSSGSSGVPKIIWKDYQSWFSAFKHQSEIFNISENDTVFVLDALSYSANLNTVLHAFWQNCTVVLQNLKNASTWNNSIENSEISSIFLVPSHYRLLVKNDNFNLAVKSIVSAGEKLDIKTAELLIKKFPNATITEYYGASELGHISFAQNQEIIQFSASVGKAFPEVKISIIEGQIHVKSPYVSPEYRNVNTVHDLGDFDSNGRLFILGRQGQVFNRRGLNIAAQEIENAALLHPFVLEAYVFEQKINDTKNNIVLVFVENNPLTIKEMHDFLLTKISKNKIPNKIIKSKELPRTTSGKVNLKLLSKIPDEDDN